MFSVIIPLYNKEKYIYDTIQSVLNQTYKDFEIIIVNDSSTDNSLGVVSNIVDKRLRIFTKPNGGVSAARNYGIKQATHSYVAFLDADDLWRPNHLECIADALRQYPECGMTHSGFMMFQGDVKNIVGIKDARILSSSKYFVVRDYFKACYVYKTILGLTSAVCIKKSILEEFNVVFQVGVQCGEDADLWLRVASMTKVLYINEHTMLYRYATENSLFITNFLDGSKDIDYTQWYNLKSDSKYKFLFLNLFIGRYAFGLVKVGKKSMAKKILSKMRGKMDVKTKIKYVFSKILIMI